MLKAMVLKTTKNRLEHHYGCIHQLTTRKNDCYRTIKFLEEHKKTAYIIEKIIKEPICFEEELHRLEKDIQLHKKRIDEVLEEFKQDNS